MSYQGRRVLVTGAAGFIGRWVARRLTDAGARLMLSVRDEEKAQSILDAWGIRGTVVHIDDPASLVRDIRPDVIFNLAGYGVDPRQRDETAAAALNTELPARLGDAVRRIGSDWTGARIVHAGSALEYGTATGDLNESTVCTPTTLYGRTKLEGTQRLLETTGTATVARLFTVYGPGEIDGRLLPSLLRAARSKEDLPLTDGRQRRDFTYVGDVADGLLRLGTLPAAGIVNLATGVLTPVRQFIETAARELGIAPGRLRFGALPTRQEEMHHDPVAVTRLRTLTGWLPPTGIDAGIAATRDHATRR